MGQADWSLGAMLSRQEVAACRPPLFGEFDYIFSIKLYNVGMMSRRERHSEDPGQINNINLEALLWSQAKRQVLHRKDKCKGEKECLFYHFEGIETVTIENMELLQDTSIFSAPVGDTRALNLDARRLLV